MLSLLSEPLFTGVAPVAPTFPGLPLSPFAGGLTVPAPRTVLLDGVQYAIETKEYRHSSRRTMRDSAAINGEASDSLFDTQGAWARYRHSWHLGGGQELDDLGDEDLSPFRFYRSQNWVPWTNGSLTTSENWSLLTNSLGGGAHLLLCGGWVLASSGTTTKVAPPIGQMGDISADALWSTVTGLSGTVLDTSQDGTTFYIGTTVGLYRLTAGLTAATLLSSGRASSVEFVANRLLVSDGNILYEVTAAGVRNEVTRHFQTNFVWKIIFAIGSRIYVGGFAGDRGELYSLATDEFGVLLRSTEATPFQQGEFINVARSHAGFVILVTNRGVRFAQVGADGTLTYGPLIKPQGWNPSYGIAVSGRYAYVSGSHSNWQGSAGSGRLMDTAILMLDLATFINTLEPAHAIVYGDVNANYYELCLSANGSLMSIDQLGGQVAVVQNANVAPPDCVLDTGLIRFGTIEEKVLVEIEVGHESIPLGTTLHVEVWDERFENIIASTTKTNSSPGSLVLGLGNTVARGCYVRLKAVRTTGWSTTTVRWWRMRAYPVVPAVQEWIVPIIAHEDVVMGEGEGQQVRQDPKAIRDTIEALWSTKVATTYVEGDASYTVRVEDFEIRPSKWSTDGKYFQPLVLCRLVRV